MVRDSKQIPETSMNYGVSILSEAEIDIDNAYIWYELK